MFLYLLNWVHLYDCALKQECLQDQLKPHSWLLWQLEGSWQWSNPEWSSECNYDISNVYIFLDLKTIILITMPKVPALRVSNVKRYEHCTCTCIATSSPQSPPLSVCIFLGHFQSKFWVIISSYPPSNAIRNLPTWDETGKRPRKNWWKLVNFRNSTKSLSETSLTNRSNHFPP